MTEKFAGDAGFRSQPLDSANGMQLFCESGSNRWWIRWGADETRRKMNRAPISRARFRLTVGLRALTNCLGTVETDPSQTTRNSTRATT